MHLLSPFVLQESETKRLRVVGGGGVLSKSDMGRRANNRGLLRRSSYDDSLTSSSSAIRKRGGGDGGYVLGVSDMGGWLDLNNRRRGAVSPIGESLHAEIRLDQMTSFRKIRTRKSDQKRAKRRLQQQQKKGKIRHTKSASNSPRRYRRSWYFH